MPNVTNFESAFENCVLLDELPFKEINDRVISIAKMYYNCSNPTNIDGFSFGISIIDATDWINKDLITSANDIVIKNSYVNFEGFTNLTSCNNLLLTSNVKTMVNFFKGDSKLNSLSLNASSDLNNVTSMAYMLNGCIGVSITPISEIPNSVKNIDYIFNGTNIANLDNLVIGSGVTSAVNWAPSNLRTINNMIIKNNVINFTGITTLQSAENLTRPNSTNWDSYFEGCTSLRNDIDFPLNTSSAKNCYKGCTSLAYVHSNWNKTYTNGITPTDCYAGCINITHINGVNLGVNSYVNGLDEVPTNWGGYGFFKGITGIYEITLSQDNTTVTAFIDSNITGVPTTYTLSDYTISWGDGTKTTGTKEHTYTNAGTYVIKGHFAIAGANYTHTSVRTALTKVIRYPTNKPLMFNNCTNLTYANFEDVCPTYRINFDGCSKLTEIVGDENLINSTLQGIELVFRGCSNLRLDFPNGKPNWVFSTNPGWASFMNGLGANLTINNDEEYILDLSDCGIMYGNNAVGAFMNTAFTKIVVNVDFSSNTTSTYSVSSIFANNRYLKEVILKGKWGYAINGVFANNPNLITVDMSDVDLGNVTSEITTQLFHNTSSITNLKFGKNLKVSISFSANPNLTVESLMSIIENVGNVTSLGTKTLTLGAVNIVKLTAEQIKIATDKGWTVV
jgi:hypothetical protein